MSTERESFEVHRGDGGERSLKTILNAYGCESCAMRKAEKHRASGLEVCVFRFTTTGAVEKIDG